jgi:hypothetical protein
MVVVSKANRDRTSASCRSGKKEKAEEEKEGEEMTDIVRKLLFRSSDEDGIGWLPNTIVHVPAGLLHEAADTISLLMTENERLRAALHWIAANTYGYEPNAMSDEEAKNYFANLFFAAQGKARAALAQGGDA